MSKLKKYNKAKWESNILNAIKENPDMNNNQLAESLDVTLAMIAGTHCPGRTALESLMSKGIVYARTHKGFRLWNITKAQAQNISKGSDRYTYDAFNDYVAEFFSHHLEKETEKLRANSEYWENEAKRLKKMDDEKELATKQMPWFRSSRG